MTPRMQGIIILILVTAIWGSTFAIIKNLVASLDAPLLIAWRFSLALIFLLAAQVLTKTKPQQHRFSSSLMLDGMLIGLVMLSGYGTQTIALQTTTANRAAFFTALSVILVPLWLAFIQKRKIALGLWIALPLAIFGIGLLSWEGGNFVIGDAWAVSCAVTYATFIVLLEKLSNKHPLLPFAIAQVAGVALLAWIWVAFTHPASFLPTPSTWPGLLYLGIASTALTTLLQTLGQRHVSAAEASLIYALEPVTASIFSFFLIHEVIGARGFVGGLFIVIATIAATIKK